MIPLVLDADGARGRSARGAPRRRTRSTDRWRGPHGHAKMHASCTCGGPSSVCFLSGPECCCVCLHAWAIFDSPLLSSMICSAIVAALLPVGKRSRRAVGDEAVSRGSSRWSRLTLRCRVHASSYDVTGKSAPSTAAVFGAEIKEFRDLTRKANQSYITKTIATTNSKQLAMPGPPPSAGAIPQSTRPRSDPGVGAPFVRRPETTR